MSFDEIRARIDAKKQQLDTLRPLSAQALASLEAWYDVELTYSSNAIEGNTLTRQETALVIDKGITVRGKPLKDHLEAIDHQDALYFVRGLVKDPRSISEADVRAIHQLVVGRSLREEAGKYSQHQRMVVGSKVTFPPPDQVPALMGAFGQWLRSIEASPETAIEAHLRLVSIHPFSDGNGRTARLLLNLILMRRGYPPIVIGPEARPDYIDSLEAAQLGDKRAYDAFMQDRLEAGLDHFISFLTVT